MRWSTVLMFLLCCTGCGPNSSGSEQAEANERATQMVRKANDAAPPLQQVLPEEISAWEIETHALSGQSCAYAPGTSLATRVIAREADAFLKLEGELVRFAADPGSHKLPMGSRSLYNGRDYSLRLWIDSAPAGTGERGNSDAVRYEGTIWLLDRWDRIIYDGVGTVSCGT